MQIFIHGNTDEPQISEMVNTSRKTVLRPHEKIAASLHTATNSESATRIVETCQWALQVHFVRCPAGLFWIKRFGDDEADSDGSQMCDRRDLSFQS